MSDADSAASDDGTNTAARVRRGLDYALLGGLVLLGVFAAIQFYLAADRTINVWVTREYRPPFKMVFNLVVLLVVGIGVSRQIGRLTASDEGDDAEATSEVTTDGGRASTTAVDDRPSNVGIETDPTTTTATDSETTTDTDAAAATDRETGATRDDGRINDDSG